MGWCLCCRGLGSWGGANADIGHTAAAMGVCGVAGPGGLVADWGGFWPAVAPAEPARRTGLGAGGGDRSWSGNTVRLAAKAHLFSIGAAVCHRGFDYRRNWQRRRADLARDST